MKNLLVTLLILSSFTVFADQSGPQVSTLQGIKQGTDIILREAAKTYHSYYVSQLYSNGTVVLYARNSGESFSKDISEVSQEYVESRSSLALNIQTVFGPKSSTLSQGSDVVVKTGVKSYTSYYVSTIYSDGAASFYNRSSGDSMVLNNSEINSQYVESWSNISLNIQTIKGPKTISMKQGTDVVIRIKPLTYQPYYVSSIYSDGFVSFYNRNTGDSTIYDYNALSLSFVESWSGLGGFIRGTDVIVRDSIKNYNSYYVSAVYSDGGISLYQRSTGETFVRPFSTLESEYVANENSLTVTIPTIGGKKDSVVSKGTDIVVRLSESNYSSFYVSAIYNDNVVVLYNRNSGESTDYTKDELSQILVESLPSFASNANHSISSGTDIALPDQAQGGIARTDFYIAKIYTDGMVALYSRESGQTEYLTASEVASKAIHAVNSKEPFNLDSIYLVQDLSAQGSEKSVFIGPSNIYEDKVLRYNVLSHDSKGNPKKSEPLLASFSDLKIQRLVCDAANTDCQDWWTKNIQEQTDPETKPEENVYALSVTPASIIDSVKDELDAEGKKYSIVSPATAKAASKSIVIEIKSTLLKTTCKVTIKENNILVKDVSKKISKKDIDACVGELK
ncbi:MAG: hypothetical protein ACXVLQ_09395 [Bacteriovorax sp.]